MKITTQRELRRQFWADHPHYAAEACDARRKSKPQNEQPASVRAAWIDYIDASARSGVISESLASRAIL